MGFLLFNIFLGLRIEVTANQDAASNPDRARRKLSYVPKELVQATAIYNENAAHYDEVFAESYGWHAPKKVAHLAAFWLEWSALSAEERKFSADAAAPETCPGVKR